MIEKKRGHYLGTEVDEKWWRRYVKGGFLARGLGEYWLVNSAIFFHRYLTADPIEISLSDIFDVKVGKWHSGMWAGGKLVVKILWKKDERKLSSGFILSPDNRETEMMVEKIRCLCSL